MKYYFVAYEVWDDGKVQDRGNIAIPMSDGYFDFFETVKEIISQYEKHQLVNIIFFKKISKKEYDSFERRTFGETPDCNMEDIREDE